MLKFSPIEIAHASRLMPFYSLRRNKTCDTGFLDSILWRDYYHIHFCVPEERAVLLYMYNEQECFAAMPFCREEDLPRYFGMLRDYFNQEMHKPLKIYLADEESLAILGLAKDPEYIVTEEPDAKDYLYSAEELRTLTGKRFHRKKNQVNRFRKEYEGRWAYRTLGGGDRALAEEFLDRWFRDHRLVSEDADGSLAAEEGGLRELIRNPDAFECRAGAILIDGRIEALSIGTYNPLEKMAVISVEKGSADIPGIYQVINQQLLLQEFPEAEIVNREDDLGLEGLRKAKESYNPIGYARKYMVLQRYGDYESMKNSYYSGLMPPASG